MQVTVGRLSLGHLDRSDTQGPYVRFFIVSLLLDNLGGLQVTTANNSIESNVREEGVNPSTEKLTTRKTGGRAGGGHVSGESGTHTSAKKFKRNNLSRVPSSTVFLRM